VIFIRVHVACLWMCVLSYFSFECLHVCAYAFKFKVHCRSAFEPGASGLPCYCTPPVCVPAVIGALAVWRQQKKSCTCWRKETITRLCASHTCVIWSAKSLSFFPSKLYIKLFEFGVEIAFNNRSAVTHHKVNLPKFPLQSTSFERTNDAFVLLIRFCFVHL